MASVSKGRKALSLMPVVAIGMMQLREEVEALNNEVEALNNEVETLRSEIDALRAVPQPEPVKPAPAKSTQAKRQ